MPLSNTPRIGKEFEQQTAVLLERVLPLCYLQGVPIFRADAAMLQDAMANELDFIVHLKHGRRHTLLIIECKAVRLTGRGDGRGNYDPLTPSGHWVAHYDPEKQIKEQLRAQRQALLANLEPLEGEVRVHAVVVAANPTGLDREPGFITTEELPSFILSAVRANRFESFLLSLLKDGVALHVQQSEILRRIRQGQPVPALGHPEIYNAIEYTRRCRAFIDSEIFRHLQLKPERWAINGSAGMGKSVLLIYATMVFITNRFIDCLRDGSRFLQSFSEGASKIRLAPLEKRRVWVISHSEKQRDMLKRMFDRFTELYGEVDSYNEYRRVKPEFHIFSEVSNIGCNILLVDEAHDLGPEGEKRVREWYESAAGNYLVIACDRHQKLRLAQDETRMIQGINFSRCTKKLSRNYRNPFPAYAGSLGLLFRWFAPTGPKTLPKPKELSEEFGFGEATLEQPGVWLLRSRNDAHPANNWSHVLSNFPSAQAAYQQLSEFPLRKEHVLWIRFSPEQSGFNYENLQHWSYHSVYGADASDLLDKYVKGQEFPVVVIEGVPEMFSWSVASGRHPQDSTQARISMWQARRQLYLAASRANVFLYFILPGNTPADVVAEFRTMFQQLAHQPEQASPSGTFWEIRIAETTEVESFASYVDAIEADPVPPPPESEKVGLPDDSPLAVMADSQPAPEQSAPLSPPRDGERENRRVADSPVHPLAVSLPPQRDDNAVAVAPVVPPAGTPKKPGRTTNDLASLGPRAKLADIAQALGKTRAEVLAKMAAKGFKDFKPHSIVNVSFVVGVVNGTGLPDSPQPPVSTPQPAPEPKPQPLVLRQGWRVGERANGRTGDSVPDLADAPADSPTRPLALSPPPPIADSPACPEERRFPTGLAAEERPLAPWKRDSLIRIARSKAREAEKQAEMEAVADSPARPLALSLPSPAHPLAVSLPPQRDDNAVAVAPVVPPAGTPKKPGRTPNDLASLGSTATLADIAQALGKTVTAVLGKMAAKGFPDLKPYSKCNVPLVVGVINGTVLPDSPQPPVSTPQPAPERQDRLARHLLRKHPAQLGGKGSLTRQESEQRLEAYVTKLQAEPHKCSSAGCATLVPASDELCKRCTERRMSPRPAQAAPLRLPGKCRTCGSPAIPGEDYCYSCGG